MAPPRPPIQGRDKSRPYLLVSGHILRWQVAAPGGGWQDTGTFRTSVQLSLRASEPLTFSRHPSPEVGSTFTLLHRSSAPICTFASCSAAFLFNQASGPPSLSFALSPLPACQLVNLPASLSPLRPTGQLINRSTHGRPFLSLWSTKPLVLPSPLAHVPPCSRAP